MATQIVEIPIQNIEDFDGLLTNNFDDIFNNDAFSSGLGNNSNTNVQNEESISSPLPNLIRKSNSNDSISSASSFFGLDMDDYQQNLLYNDDVDSDFMSPLFPQSPSMDELSTNFTSLAARHSDEEASHISRGQKNEKVENNEEESTSESSADSSSESEESNSEENRVTAKKSPISFADQQQQGLHQDEDSHDATLNDDDDEYRPVKKRFVGPNKNDSFSSVSSYSSGASDSEGEDLEYEDDDEFEGSKNYEPITKKYKQPVSLRADDLRIGGWSLQNFSQHGEDVSLDIKILFGRRKIKYEICRPNKVAKTKTTLVIDFPFSSISGLEFKTKEQVIVFQLAELPTFTRKEKGKCAKVEDFTNGNASTYQRHHIHVLSGNAFTEYMERLLSCDRRLRQLAKVGLSPIESTFPATEGRVANIPMCDWDKENKATKYCEECTSNFCDVCDDVLHRHATHRLHNRLPVQIIVKPPPQPPKPKKAPIKKRKKMNSDRCRCGTGATKGTLGEPCTGNRCPCFSNGKSCVNCGCKNCANPIKKTKAASSARVSQEASYKV